METAGEKGREKQEIGRGKRITKETEKEMRQETQGKHKTHKGEHKSKVRHRQIQGAHLFADDLGVDLSKGHGGPLPGECVPILSE
jgi:hypothetical protein